MHDSLQSIANEVLACKKCPLYKTARRGVPGEGPAHATIMLIGQAPGAQEDATGRPFVGRAGAFLNELLHQISLPRKDIFITSVVKHFPPKNRIPHADEVAACKPYLERQITLVNPRIVVLLGKVAEQSLCDHPLLKNRTVVATVHPAAAMRFPALRKKIKRDFETLCRLARRL